MADPSGKIFDIAELRNRVRVFHDRSHAGEVLAGMMGALRGTPAVVFGIPAGGVPVAAEIARRLDLPLDVAVVSKITLPWNTEAGYGAVAFDGTVRLNEALISSVGLSSADVEAGVAATGAKVARRLEKMRGRRPFPDLSERAAVIVDDGLASGFTMRTAVEALHRLRAHRIIVAVPTGHAASVAEIAGPADAVYCANVRGAGSFAVADAYERWYDVSEDDALRAFESCRQTEDRR